jgi:hypothetical protein
MKTLSLFITAAVFLIPACAYHSLEVQGDAATITLKALNAKEVLFASSLDGYELHPAQKQGTSRWVVKAPSGTPFSYFYVVDGKIFVPDCRLAESDDFGSRNCIYVPGM